LFLFLCRVADYWTSFLSDRKQFPALQLSWSRRRWPWADFVKMIALAQWIPSSSAVTISIYRGGMAHVQYFACADKTVKSILSVSSVQYSKVHNDQLLLCTVIRAIKAKERIKRCCSRRAEQSRAGFYFVMDILSRLRVHDLRCLLMMHQGHLWSLCLDNIKKQTFNPQKNPTLRVRVQVEW
jgi:hypothetical protein